MVKKTLSVLALAISLLPAAFAADGPTVFVGGATLLRLPADAGHVVLGNPAIADITLQSRRTLVLFGKFPGGTSLLVTDPAGAIILQTLLVVTASSPDGVTIRYGSGKNWVPGGIVASAECRAASCAPAAPLPSAATPAPAPASTPPPPSSPSLTQK
jgi:hypothetical protein